MVRSVVMNTIAVLPHLKKQPTAYLINVTSGMRLSQRHSAFHICPAPLD